MPQDDAPEVVKALTEQRTAAENSTFYRKL